MASQMNERAVVGFLTDAFSENEDMIFDREANFPTLAAMEEGLKDPSCTQLLWLVREIREGGQRGTGEYPYDSDLIRRVLERGRDSLNDLISMFYNL